MSSSSSAVITQNLNSQITAPMASRANPPPPAKEDEIKEVSEMEASINAVENILGYRFRDRKLLEDALTHPSYTASASYQRLEFFGDAALAYVLSLFFLQKYPHLDQGKLSCLRSANVSTEKLARAAVRHRLYKFVRHNVTALEEKVSEFVKVVSNECEPEIYGGLVKAPKVLADIVESVAAAVSVDCNHDLKIMWATFTKLLEPIYMLDVIEKQPQPVTTLFELCQKDGKRVDIKYQRKDDINIASIYVDGSFVASASSEEKENAKLQAVKEALKKLPGYNPNDALSSDIFSQLNGTGAKQRLHELCGKRKWPKPNYKIESEVGPSHEKRYKCSVEVETAECVLVAMGDETARVKEAENSAASALLGGLKGSKFV